MLCIASIRPWDRPTSFSFSHSLRLLTLLYALDRSIVAVYRGRCLLFSLMRWEASIASTAPIPFCEPNWQGLMCLCRSSSSSILKYRIVSHILNKTFRREMGVVGDGGCFSFLVYEFNEVVLPLFGGDFKVGCCLE